LIPLFNLFLLVFTGLAVGFDVRERRIPNRLVLIGIVAGILFNGSAGRPQLFDSVLGLGLGLGILLLPFAFGWLGAGDVKFFGAVGALLGVKFVPRVFFYSALLGGVLAVISIAFRGMSLRIFRTAWWDLKVLVASRGAVLPESVGKQSRVDTVPYGVAIGLGTLVAFYLDPVGEWAGF